MRDFVLYEIVYEVENDSRPRRTLAGGMEAAIQLLKELTEKEIAMGNTVIKQTIREVMR